MTINDGEEIMLGKVFALSGLIMVSLGFSPFSLAEQESAEPATVVVYRADEPAKTARLRLDVHFGEGSLGRLNADQAVVITQPAGEYTLGTNIKGTEPLVMDLKPGQTYYVHTRMSLKGNGVKVQMSEVEEQVAKLKEPVLNSAI